MPHHLITFLGKGRKAEGGYSTATYHFPGGTNKTKIFFGLALLEELATSRTPVDHLLVLGTSSSIWDALLADEMRDSDLWTELGEKVEKGEVDDALLAKVADDAQNSMSQAGLVRKVSLRIIPFGRDEQGQIAILQQMAGLVGKGDQVSLDVTHGFRSLPMLGLLSAVFLKQLKGARVNGIYYGALEMTEASITPVLRLDGLLRIAEWLTSLSAFRTSGDYGLFTPLLNEAAGIALQRASFFERTLNISQARQHLRDAEELFPEIEKHDPVFKLFASELRGFTAWAREQSFAGRQLAAAKNALATGNFVRAAALAVEACISHHLPNSSDPMNFTARSQARDELNRRCQGQNWPATNPTLAAYRELSDLRNALSHGTRSQHNTMNQQATLQDEKKLRDRLTSLLATLQEVTRQ